MKRFAPLYIVMSVCLFVAGILLGRVYTLRYLDLNPPTNVIAAALIPAPVNPFKQPVCSDPEAITLLHQMSQPRYWHAPLDKRDYLVSIKFDKMLYWQGRGDVSVSKYDRFTDFFELSNLTPDYPSVCRWQIRASMTALGQYLVPQEAKDDDG